MNDNTNANNNTNNNTTNKIHVNISNSKRYSNSMIIIRVLIITNSTNQLIKEGITQYNYI